MLENLQHFVKGVKEFMNDEQTTLEEKTEIFVGNYIDLLIHQPDLPLFILNELRSNPKKLLSKIGIKAFLFKSKFMKQYKEAVSSKGIAQVLQ